MVIIGLTVIKGVKHRWKWLLSTKEEYDSLIEDSNWLTCLEASGVDNWGGIDYAQELYEQDFGGEQE